MQKLKCILKILFNNDELTPRAKKIKAFHTIETKWGIRNYCQARILKLCSQRESKSINVKNTCFVFKYFKILLASKSRYSKQQDSHITLS